MSDCSRMITVRDMAELLRAHPTKRRGVSVDHTRARKAKWARKNREGLKLAREQEDLYEKIDDSTK